MPESRDTNPNQLNVNNNDDESKENNNSQKGNHDENNNVDENNNNNNDGDKEAKNKEEKLVSSLVASYTPIPPSSPSSTSSSSSCPTLFSPFAQTASAFRRAGDRRWNFRLLLLLGVFFLSYTANMGGGHVTGLFEENAPFCWDSDKLGNIATIRTFAGCLCSVATLLLIRSCVKPGKASGGAADYPPIALCILLSLTSHLIYAFAFKVELPLLVGQ